jgi:hypothetical protein
VNGNVPNKREELKIGIVVKNSAIKMVGASWQGCFSGSLPRFSSFCYPLYHVIRYSLVIGYFWFNAEKFVVTPKKTDDGTFSNNGF